MTARTICGGTFCRFTVGSPAPNASVRYLRYIANEESVREKEQGTLLWNLPAIKTPSGSYREMTTFLADFAKADASFEQARHQARGQARTHYRVLLSFESDPGTARANGLVAQWIAEVFPSARVAAFQHRNTLHLHTHLWIAARLTTGRKINLSARAFRQLDERWNRIYSQAFSRPEQEHLLKKWQMERHKQLAREGSETTKPFRVADVWRPEMFNERELTRLGAGRYERNESGTHSDQHAPSGNYPHPASREPAASGRHPEIERSTQNLHRAERDAERAVSEAVGLYEAASQVAARVVEREREINPETNHGLDGLERERER